MKKILRKEINLLYVLVDFIWMQKTVKSLMPNLWKTSFIRNIFGLFFPSRFNSLLDFYEEIRGRILYPP